MKRLPVAALLAVLFAASASAQQWKPLVRDAGKGAQNLQCVRKDPAHAGGTQAYADEIGAGKCFVSVHGMAGGMVYRDYAFFSDGMLMVFNSYGDGEDTRRFTSAREFYFFPRANAPDVDLDPAAPSVVVTMANGDRVTFNTDDAQIASVGRGGVEFPSYNGLMLDVGFRMGELPSGLPNGDATFRSAYGQTCTVKNKELFTYASGDRALKMTDAELSLWLKTRCPGLYVDF
ncbi:MAG: hypothetical protein HY925_16195 [Elusimicrobia bacterium]|nr:hypothetical protein [Elusimicrobiota bacterium]